MPPIRASFLEFYPPNPATLPTCPAALPLVQGDVLTLQALPVGLAPNPALSYQLALLQYDPASPGGWLYLADDFLPVYVDPQGRVRINDADLPALLPTQPGGLYRLGLRTGGALVGVSNELRLLRELPYSRSLRYRGTDASTIFDYTDLPYYQRLRLPLRLDRPRYTPEQQVQDGVLLPLYNRLHKSYTLETDYLSEHLLEALQLALRHEGVQLQDPTTGLFEPYLPTTELVLTWADTPHLPLARATCQLEQLSFVGASINFAPVVP
jgi:hypothetical protein